MEEIPSSQNNDAPGGLASAKILAELVALAREFAVDVKVEEGDFATSLCRIKGQPFVYINSNEPVNRAAEVIADALSGQDLEARFILPEVRALLEGTAIPAPAAPLNSHRKH